MRRAVVSTTSGCAGLGLVDRESVWVADTAEDFAAGITALTQNRAEREKMAQSAYEHANAQLRLGRDR